MAFQDNQSMETLAPNVLNTHADNFCRCFLARTKPADSAMVEKFTAQADHRTPQRFKTVSDKSHEQEQTAPEAELENPICYKC